MITGVDRAVFIKYDTGALSTGAIRGENSGGPKKSPRTSSIVQVIFPFGPLRSERNQKFIIGLDSFSYQCLIYLVPFGNILVFVSTTMLKDAKFQ